jgi:5-methylcytosine-specific restriction endonuclease McrA
LQAGIIEPSTVCDHIEPHKGDTGLFYNTDNLQCLCKRCHDGLKQSIEKRGYDKTIGLNGWPVDPNHPANKVSHRN